MDLCQSRRADMKKMEYLSTERVELRYSIPLAEVVIDFFDALEEPHQGLRLARLRTRAVTRRVHWCASTS
jgi:translation elongation factor EF-4